MSTDYQVWLKLELLKLSIFLLAEFLVIHSEIHSQRHNQSTQETDSH